MTTLDLKMQKISGTNVNSVGSKAVVNNIVKDLNGNFVTIQNGEGYTYDSQTHKVIFDRITQTGDKSYPFSKDVQIGNAHATFSGNVTQNIVYNELAVIQDDNLRTALNRAIASQTSTTRTDNQDIIISELKALRDTLDLMNFNIVNLIGLEHCTNIDTLKLAHNKITDIDPLRALKGLTFLSLDDNQITNIDALRELTSLNELYLGWEFANVENNRKTNTISDLSPLQELNNLRILDVTNNEVSDISLLQGLTNLEKLRLSSNHIVDLSSLNSFKANSLNIKMENQSITLKNTVVNDGSVEITNPVIYPAFYKEKPYVNISPSGNISYIKEENKLKLSNLNDSINEFTIDESAIINNANINGNYSVNINLPVEHVSTIKVDLPTSMTFNVVTNTIDSEPVFATADHTINNRGKKPVNITPSYTVTSPSKIDLVESINDSEIAMDDNVKIAVKLKNLSTNEDILSVVNGKTGTQFSVGAESNVQLRFEPGTNGMADAKKEQLSDTKTTAGKMTFTISN